MTVSVLKEFTAVSFPGGLVSKESAYNAGDLDSIPGLGRSPGEQNGNPLQCSCLEDSMDIRFWQTTVYGVEKRSDTTERLTLTFTWYLWGDWLQDPRRHKNLLKPLIENGVIFANNLCTSSLIL